MTHSHPVGGRIRHFLPGWQAITPDKLVLQIVQQDYTLPFLETPPPLPPSIEPLMEDHLSLLQQEVRAVLAKGAIERVLIPEVGHGCYSHYFLVPKKNGGICPILDLRPLNAFLRKDKFRRVTLTQVLSELEPGDWMVA